MKKKMRTRKRTTTMKRSNRVGRVALLVVFALLAQAIAEKKPNPKEPYALVFGTVFGPNERPVPGVKVEIRRAGEKRPIELVSDARGEFAHRFPAGAADYVIWADLKDKQAAQKTEVKVHVDND